MGSLITYLLLQQHPQLPQPLQWLLRSPSSWLWPLSSPADQTLPLHTPHQATAYSDAAPAYQYDYAVKDDYSGVNFGQNEARDGYNTHGSYYVALPDGRLQRVTYTVNGDEGYVAEVTYEGHATYPDHKPAYKAAPAHHKPSYHPAPAAYKPAPYHA